MQTLFASLDAMFYTAARCAAALGITRQAYHQARTRRRLSDRAAIRAAALLKIDPGQALLINATGQNPPAPKLDTPANPPHHPPRQPLINADTPTLYYVKSKNENVKCCDAIKKNRCTVHSITSQDKADQIDLIRWVLAVARIPADSPRFAQYVSRWVVPEKIARAKANGTFNDAVKNCPPIHPDWLRYVPAALLAYREFITPKPVSRTPQKQVAMPNARKPKAKPRAA